MSSTFEPRGAILDPEAAARAFRITRHPPAAALAPFVRHLWFVRWDLRGCPEHRQRVLSLPAVNLVFEPETSGVWGVPTAVGERVLAGAGRVYGVNFRSAGFQPFWRRSMHLLADRRVEVEAVFTAPAQAVHRALYATDDDAEALAILDTFLRADLPSLDTPTVEAERVVTLAREERGLVRVEDLADAAGVSVRTLQRLVRRQVGVGPKWLLRLFRIHDASAQLSAGQVLDQARFARSLGYFDQAHFVRDFTAVVGSPPARYAARCATT